MVSFSFFIVLILISSTLGRNNFTKTYNEALEDILKTLTDQKHYSLIPISLSK